MFQSLNYNAEHLFGVIKKTGAFDNLEMKRMSVFTWDEGVRSPHVRLSLSQDSGFGEDF